MKNLNEQSQLVIQYQATGSNDLLSQIFESVKKYVNKEVKNAYTVLMKSERGHSLDFDDLLQDSFFVIKKAADSYDHRAGANFFTHLCTHHLGATLVTRYSKKYDTFCQSWQVLDTKAGNNKLPKRVPVPNSLESEGSIEERMEMLDEHAKLVGFLATIDRRDRGIIIDRFRDGKTLEEIGQSLSITRERVRQLEKRGLERIEEGYSDYFHSTEEEEPSACDPVDAAVKCLKAMRLLESVTGAQVPCSLSPRKWLKAITGAAEIFGLLESDCEGDLHRHGGELARVS